MGVVESAEWTEVLVYGQYADANGKPARGVVVFELEQQGIVFDGKITIPTKKYARLIDGTMSTHLPATNDPDLSLTNWFWKVTERIGGKSRPPYYLEVPYEAGSINLATAVPVAPQPVMLSALSAAILSNPEIFEGVGGGGGTSMTFGTIQDSDAVGTAGQMVYDTNYIYLCVATNTWRRVQITPWMAPK